MSKITCGLLLCVVIAGTACKEDAIVYAHYSGKDSLLLQTRIMLETTDVGEITSTYPVIKMQFSRPVDVSSCDSFLYTYSVLGNHYINLKRATKNDCSAIRPGDTVRIFYKSNILPIDATKQEKILRELNKSLRNVDSILQEP